MEWFCCDNPTVTEVRETSTADGGKKKYYKCLNCQADHVLTYSGDGRIVDQQTSA